jgi:hypothetical protein
MSRNQQTLSKLTVIKQLKDLRENKIEKVKRTENSKGNHHHQKHGYWQCTNAVEHQVRLSAWIPLLVCGARFKAQTRAQCAIEVRVVSPCSPSQTQ